MLWLTKDCAMKRLIFWLCFSVISSPTLFGLGILAVIISILATRKVGKSARIRIRLSVVLLALVLLSVISVSKIHRYQSLIVDPEAYKLIEPGMTQAQVLSMLDQPSSRKCVTKNHVMWRYGKPGVWEFVEIEFDTEGKVRSKFRDN